MCSIYECRRSDTFTRSRRSLPVRRARTHHSHIHNEALKAADDSDAAKQTVGGQRFGGIDARRDVAGIGGVVEQQDARRGHAQVQVLLHLVHVIAGVIRLEHHLLDDVDGVRDQVVGGRELAGADGAHADHDG